MNKKVGKRFLAMILAASMIIPSVPSQAAADSARDAAETDVFLPEAAYYWNFEDGTTLTNKGAAGGTAELKGTAGVVDAEIGIGDNTFVGGSNHALSLNGTGYNTAYVELPTNLYEGVSAETGLTWSFWMREADSIGSYSRVFSSANSSGKNEFAYTSYTTSPYWNVTFDGSYQLKYKNDNPLGHEIWNYITITVSGEEAVLYINGERCETELKSGNADVLKTRLNELAEYHNHTLGKTTQYTDPDCKAQLDDVAIYKTILTAEQVKAAYDLYADYDDIQALIPQVQEKLPVAEAAIEGKSASFYTKESYTTLQKAIKAIKAGEIAVATPATKAQLTKLLNDLNTELVYYEGVTESTTFSKAQLEAEIAAARESISAGGLTSDARQKIQAAADAAEEAVKDLTGTEGNAQETVDNALMALREVTDGLNEASLATPVINKQPVKAVYKLGEKVSPLTVEATLGVAGDENKSLRYQWYQNTVKNTEGGTVIEGATKNTYTPSIATIGKTYYYCKVTNTNPALEGKSKVTDSNVVLVRVKGTEEVNVPAPYYEFTFDVTADNGTEVTNVGSKEGVKAKIEGVTENDEGEATGLGIEWSDERASNVLNLPGGSTNGAVEGRLSLPENMFAEVTNDGFAFSFWINIDEKAGQYSRIFSGTVNGQNSSDSNNNKWDAPEFSFVAGSETAGDMAEDKAGYNTAVILPDRNTQLKLVWEEQFAKGKWQHVTVSVSPESYDVYLDGELVGIKYDRNNNMSTVLASLFADNAAILKQYVDCAIGSSVYNTDKDLKAKVDEFRFYNTHLTTAQAEAAYDSYAVSKELVAQLEAKVAEAKAKSISFYTRESYDALTSAITAGEEGIDNPVTNANVIGLMSKLDETIKALEYYGGIDQNTTFSKAQLQAETGAAKIISNVGGLAPASESALSEAIEAAETALALTGTEANAQATVDAALAKLRTAVDAMEYEDAAATPQISDDGQPQDATYTKGDTSVEVTPLTVAATVSDKGSLSYQWYQNTANSTTGGSKIEDADKASYTPDAAETGTIYYYCEVTNTQDKAVTTKTATAMSNVAAVTVKEVKEPSVTSQWQNEVYEVGDTAVTLTVEAAAGDEGTLSYQWYKKETEGAEGTEIPGATDKSYTPSTAELGETYYYCMVTNTIGTAAKRTESSIVLIQVVKDKSAVAAKPTINKQPQDAEYTTSDTPQPLTIEAAKSGEGTLSYQWYQNTSNSTVGGTAIRNAVEASYTPIITEVGTTYYYCIVTNTKGSATATVTSKIAAVTVTKGNDEPTVAAPEITKQPVGAVYTYGNPAKALSVAASVSDGGTLSYQWYQNTSNSVEGGTAVKDATKDTYTPAVTAVGTVYYYCEVTNTKGTKTAVANSNVAAIKVNKASSSITGVSSSVKVVFGKSVTLKAKGQGAVTYKSSNKKVLTVGKSNGKIKTVGYGKAQVTITAAGNQNYNAATRKITVTVKPKKMTVSSVKSTKKKTLTVKWKKDAKADGYKIQYSTDKKFKKGVKTMTVKKNKTVKTTLKKLKAGKKYYVRICAYKGSGKNQVSGDWSKAKSTTVKKK